MLLVMMFLLVPVLRALRLPATMTLVMITVAVAAVPIPLHQLPVVMATLAATTGAAYLFLLYSRVEGRGQSSKHRHPLACALHRHQR